jgi:alkylation response protein AidB-like acyl-CoA dehydrogenase
MDFGWTRAQDELFERMRSLGARVQARPGDERLAALAEGGALGLCLAREYGGQGFDLLTTARAFEALGASLDDSGVLLAAGAHLFGVGCTLQRLGSHEQKQYWLPRLASGSGIATVAATEETSGSNVAEVQATVSTERVSGDKRFVTQGDRASLYLFLGKNGAGRGLSVALIAAGDGVRADRPYDLFGLHGARVARVRFDCSTDRSVLLGKPGAGMAVFQVAMTFERALVLAFRLGAMDRTLNETIAAVRARRLDGARAKAHQAVAHRVARMKQRLESARLMVYRAAWELDRGGRGQLDAALAKWQLADAAVASVMDALRVRAGAGYLDSSGLGHALADAIGGSIHSGTSDVLAEVVAGWLGVS